MRQLYPDDTKRNLWGRAREKNRLKARFAIRERVASGGVDLESTPFHEPDSLDVPRHSLDVDESPDTDQVTLTVLERIYENDRSYFSLSNIEENLRVYNSPIGITSLYKEQGDSLTGEERLISWYGEDGLKNLQTFFSALRTITIMEVALIFQRYAIVGSLLLGGVNPCIRGVLVVDYRECVIEDGDWHERLVHIGSKVLRKFFAPVPLALQTYIVKRSFEFRQQAFTVNKSDSCGLCQETPPVLFQLRMDHSCHHIVCESCFWNDILTNLDDRSSDVAPCPVCYKTDMETRDMKPTECEQQSPSALFLLTRQKFFNLPRDSKELRKRKQRPKKRPPWVSTWSEAASLSLGNSQDVRKDKFFAFIERGSIHFVQACLEAGINLEASNEYGQTALYFAAWRGYEKLVRLLLQYGSNPNQTANDGTTPLYAAKISKMDAIVNLLEKLSGTDLTCRTRFTTCCEDSHQDLSVYASTLIGPNEDYAGAGSYILDNILTNEEEKQLLELWAGLPTEVAAKKKAGLCSVRSYYCDIDRFISNIILRALELSAENLRLDSGSSVLSFMRFLSYDQPTTMLAPHVDLSRVEFDTGKRSTHSFLLYLTDCQSGGETSLLKDLRESGEDNVIVRVKPKAGRLLLFPHQAPHEGQAVVDIPKLLIRGEVILAQCLDSS